MSTMDGADITHTFHTGDIPLGGLSVETQVDRIRVISKSRHGWHGKRLMRLKLIGLHT